MHILTYFNLDTCAAIAQKVSPAKKTSMLTKPPTSQLNNARNLSALCVVKHSPRTLP